MTTENDLCNSCPFAKGLAEGEECHPPKDSDCPANKSGTGGQE